MGCVYPHTRTAHLHTPMRAQHTGMVTVNCLCINLRALLWWRIIGTFHGKRIDVFIFQTLGRSITISPCPFIKKICVNESQPSSPWQILNKAVGSSALSKLFLEQTPDVCEWFHAKFQFQLLVQEISKNFQCFARDTLNIYYRHVNPTSTHVDAIVINVVRH